MLSKPPPRQLEPEVVETVWPGDDAIDLTASDLVTWCKEGGSAGLTIKPHAKPAVIRLRPLSIRALNRVMRVMVSREPNYPYEAFRHGVLAVEGEALEWDTFGGVRGLRDSTLDSLSELQCDLPSAVLSETFVLASGGQANAGVNQELRPVSLPEALGYQILALTFRLRGDRA